MFLSAALARRSLCGRRFGLRWRGRLDATSRVRSFPPVPLSVCVPTPLMPLANVPGVFPSYFPASRCPADDGRTRHSRARGKRGRGEGDSGFLVRNCCRSTHVSARHVGVYEWVSARARVYTSGVESRVNYYGCVLWWEREKERAQTMVIERRRKKKEYILWICISAYPTIHPDGGCVKVAANWVFLGARIILTPPLGPLFSGSTRLSLFCLPFCPTLSTNRLVSTRAGQLVRVTRVSRDTVSYVYIFIFTLVTTGRYVRDRLISEWRDQTWPWKIRD